MEQKQISNSKKLIIPKTEEQIRAENLQRVAGFRIMDDTYARVFFKDKPELAEYVLKTITRLDDLEIDAKDYKTQYDAKRTDGSRSLVLDVHGSDKKGRKYDLEVEKWDASAPRAEYHMAIMLTEHLHEGDDTSKLPETYVIFVCEHDVKKNKRAVNHYCYRNEDSFLESDEIEKDIPRHESMGGRTHIMFVNGDYVNNNTDIGRLIHDFKCTKAEEMYNKNLAQRTRYLKDNPKGVEEVCESMRTLRDESEKVGRLKDILNIMHKHNWDVETTMDFMDIEESERPVYAASVEYALSRPVAVAN